MAALLVLWRLVQNLVNAPRIMGHQLEMEPVTVLLAMVVVSQVGGLLGVILSVPVVAALRIEWLEHSSRQKSAVA
jgi:predicted PurR-regulated permease PerM